MTNLQKYRLSRIKSIGLVKRPTSFDEELEAALLAMSQQPQVFVIADHEEETLTFIPSRPNRVRYTSSL